MTANVPVWTLNVLLGAISIDDGSSDCELLEDVATPSLVGKCVGGTRLICSEADDIGGDDGFSDRELIEDVATPSLVGKWVG